MRFLKIQLLAVLLVAVLVAGAQAARPAHPPVSWQPTHANFTPAHREPGDIRYIVIHTTEGSADGAVSWFENSAAHASAHFVIDREGHITQLVRVRNIAWHAGNWAVNTTSIGIEHEGVVGDPSGYTTAEYRASARLVAYLARTFDVPIDRNHIIGHSEVPDPSNPNAFGGADHHTDPGPYWNWARYMHLVRLYAGKVHVLPQVRIDRVLIRRGVLSGVVDWATATTRGVRRVDFRVDGDLVFRDTRRPFVLPRLNTTDLANGTHVLEVHAYGRAGVDVWRKVVRVRNEAFGLSTSGVQPRQTVAGVVHLAASGAGAPIASASLFVDGKLVQRDRQAPFTFAWNSRTIRNGDHVLAVRAQAPDGRVAWTELRISVLNPVTAPGPPAQILGQSLTDGQTVSGLVDWRVQVQGAAQRVDFYIDGIKRGTSTYLPFHLIWDTQAETAGTHVLEVHVVRPDLTQATARLTVTVASP